MQANALLRGVKKCLLQKRLQDDNLRCKYTKY
jgi:hypothetical protein